MNIITELREKHGMSRYALSKQTGLVQSTLLNLENENYNIKDAKYRTLEKIAKVFNLSVDDLVRMAVEK